MAIKHRCMRCLKVLRADGTCQNPKCVRYVPEQTPEQEDNGEEGTEGKTVGYVPDKTEDNGEDSEDSAE